MTLTPKDREEVCRMIADAASRRETVTACDLAALNRVVEHAPEDMTVTVEAGMTLAGLQAVLAKGGQCLPIDPPHPERVTVGELISENLSGPRRYGYGTIRDSLIGLRVVLANGRLVHSGGKVVKNVAGYDLQKLFVGSRGTLGVIVEATFKLRPLPEAERIVQARCESCERANQLIEGVAESELVPVIFDWHNVGIKEAGRSVLCLGFAGSREEVDWQVKRAGELGIGEAGGLDEELTFWSEGMGAHRKVSVLPSSVVETVKGLGADEFVARAGNGVIYYRGGKAPEKERNLAGNLNQRVKEIFDPNGTFH
jgi:FAD/FMN-containing dehydrogenase